MFLTVEGGHTRSTTICGCCGCITDDLEKRLAQGPVIPVPTITLEGDANGPPHLDPSAYANKFSGKYANRIIKGGVGQNLPQEALQDFAKAVIDVDDY